MADIDALLNGFATRLEVVEKSLGISGGGGGGGGAAAAPSTGGSTETSVSVKAFDAFSNPELEKFKAACVAIGGEDAATCSKLVSDAWAAQRAFLVMASECKKPTDMMAAMKACGVVDACQAANKAVKRGDFELHYKTVQEGLGALNWLMVEPKPRDVIEAQVGAQDYHANKIRVQYKRNTDKFDANQHQFCDSFKKLLNELIPYTKEHHLTGVAWNFKGKDSTSFAPPAAPVPAAKPAAAAAATVVAGGGIGDLKNELKMDNAAAGLKKVTKDMQTWRADYKGGDAPKPKPKVAPRPVVVKTKGTHMVEFRRQGMRWCVEAQTKEDGVVTVNVEDVKHSVAIYGCFQATIDIKGKCKGVTIDSCEQVKVLVDTVLSSVELVNCKRMQVQIRDVCPSVAIDKTDGCQVYLSKDGLETTFTTAKSSEMNVCFPDPKSEDGELIETPIPEQFVHKVILDENPHMSADVSDLYTH